MNVTRRAAAAALLALASATGCRDAGSVEVQPLPPLERPSAEARAGLPELAGVWHFAGFEIAPGDTAPVRSGTWGMLPPGEIRLETQRLDSVAGRYRRDGAEFPLVGEVRRDSTFALVALGGGGGSFVAGHLRRDTLWIELTNLAAAESWPRGARAGMVRRGAGEPFLRLLGGAPIEVPDTVAPVDEGIADGTPPPGIESPGTPSPAVAEPRREPVAPRPEARPRAEPARPEPRPEPREEPRRPPPAQPERRGPPLLGRPVDPTAEEPAPAPAGPRDTLRFDAPPR